MRIFVDLDSDSVISAPGFSQPVSSLEWKRSPYATLEVQFTRLGIIQELANDATGIFEIKETGNYDENPVVQALAWAKTGTGTSTVYTFIFSLVNSTLDALFDVEPPGTDTDLDPTQITFMGEVQWATGGQIHKTPTLTVLIDNDVVREGDVGPSTPVLMYGIFMPSITRLTGGTPTDLDYLPTVPLLTGTILELLIDDGFGNLQWLPQVLEAGISAGPGVTTPLDYNASTNNRRWKTATALSGSAGTNGGIKYTFSTNTANTDPTAGFLKFDNATIASITNLRISNTDADTRGLAAFLATWDASTTTPVRGYVIVQKDAAPGNFVIFQLTGARTDNTGWKNFPITYVASGGTLAGADTLRVFFFRTGDMGVQGPPGGALTFDYLWDTGTSDADPGAGKVRGNNATTASITTLFIDLVDHNGNTLTSVFDSLDGSSSTVKGHFWLVKKLDATKWMLFSFSARTTATGYRKFTVAQIAQSGASPFSASDEIFIMFSRTGDKGSTGTGGGVGLALVGYTWNTSTANADPGTAKISSDNASPTSATVLHVNATNGNAQNVGGSLNSLFNGINSAAIVVVADASNPDTIFAVFIANQLTNHSTYYDFAIPGDAISNAGTLLNNAAVTLSFLPIAGFYFGSTKQSQPSNPTGTTSTTNVMMGINQTATPSFSGTFLAIISGDIFNAGGVGDGATVQLRYGTGTPPTNGAAATGSAVGGKPNYISSTTAGKVPFSVQAVVTGLTMNTAIWFDLAVAAITGGTATVENLSFSVIEIPSTAS